MHKHLAGVWFELGVWLFLAIIAYVLTFEFAAEAGSYEWGAASWPRTIIVLLAVSAIVHALVRRNTFKVDNSDPASAISHTGDEQQRSLAEVAKLVGLFAIPLLYVYLLPRAGFYLTTPFFLLLYLFYLGERRWRILVFAPLLIYFLINLVFTKLFYVALPTGIWPGFYDFSNWFLSFVR